eukprot:2547469-Amphidinium_carterae.1
MVTLTMGFKRYADLAQVIPYLCKKTCKLSKVCAGLLGQHAALGLFCCAQLAELASGLQSLDVLPGAAHSWAVVYALFIAIHTRAMRYDGYHEGYTEHLPFFVSWTETLSVASMGVWWVAGFTTAAIRIVDDESGTLPMEGRDVAGNLFTKLIRSPILQSVLALAHVLSCV